MKPARIERGRVSPELRKQPELRRLIPVSAPGEVCPIAEESLPAQGCQNCHERNERGAHAEVSPIEEMDDGDIENHEGEEDLFPNALTKNPDDSDQHSEPEKREPEDHSPTEWNRD